MKRLFLVLGSIALILSVCGCVKEELQTNLSVLQNMVEIEAAGGEGEVQYVVENPSPDGQIKAIAEKDWVNIVSSDEGKICFTVEENFSFDPRFSSIEILYTPGNKRASFKIRQEAAEEFVFRIEMDEIKQTSAKVNIIPADKEMQYITMVVTKEEYETNMNADDDVLFIAVFSTIEAYAERFGMTIGEYLQESGMAKKGVLEGHEYKNLKVNTDHYAFAIGFSDIGQQTSELVKAPFKTTEFEEQDVSFDIKAEVSNSTTVTVDIEPSGDFGYYTAIYPKRTLDQSNGDLKKVAQGYIDGIIYMANYRGISKEEALAEARIEGKYHKVTENKHPETDYFTIAFTINEDGYVNSEVASVNFRTEAVVSDNVIDITIDELGMDYVTITTTPSNSDKYVPVMVESSLLEGKSDEEILKYLQANYMPMLTKIIQTDKYTTTYRNLASNQKYTALAFGFNFYEGPYRTTEYYRLDFTTKESESSENMTYEFEDILIGDRFITAKAKGQPETALFLWGICPAESTEEEVKATIQADIDWNIGYAYKTGILNKSQYMRVFGTRGESSKRIEKLKSNTEYKYYAIGVDDKTGEYVSEMYFGKTVRTTDPVIADVTIEMTYEKYFDGTDVSMIHPEYAFAVGKSIVPFDIKVTGEYENYFFIVAIDDWTGKTDDELIDLLVKNGQNMDAQTTYFICPYDQTLTALAVAKDKNGYYGRVYKKTMKLSKDGVSPADEFVMPDVKCEPNMVLAK